MKKIATLCLAALTAATVVAQDQTIEAAADALGQRFMDAWNGADAAGVASLFAEDGDQIGYGGASSKGRAAVQETYAGVLDTYKGSSLQLVRTGLHVVAPDVVITDGTWEIIGGTNTEGAPTKGFYTFILAKHGDAWHLVSNRVKVPPTN